MNRFRLLYGLAIRHLDWCELVSTNATANPTAAWIARRRGLFLERSTEVHASQSRRLLWPNVWTLARRDGHSRRPIAPRSPWQN
jgi:hypothetical protein